MGRIYVNGQEKRYRADNKTQAKALYGRLKADIREKKYFPEKDDHNKDTTLQVWIKRCLEGSTKRGIRNEMRYGRFWKLVAFAVETGLRREEQFQLRWDQVSLETSTLILPLPKEGKTRHVPLSDVAKQILRSRDSFLFSQWVFPRKVDPKKAESAQCFVKAVYTTALHRVGITDACWHTLRHTAASRRGSWLESISTQSKRSSDTGIFPQRSGMPVLPLGFFKRL